MSVRKISLPCQSALNEIARAGDFVDSWYNDAVPTGISVSQAAFMALTDMPFWVDGLMRVRNFAVSFYGLKTGSNSDQVPEKSVNLKVNDQLGVFRVQSVLENEILLGENDKHLDFLISVLRHKTGIVLSTWVHTHNRFGKAYLLAIMPFHKLIVRDGAKRIGRSL